MDRSAGSRTHAEEDVLALLTANGWLQEGGRYELIRLQGGFWNDVLRLRGEGLDWAIKRFAVTSWEGLYPILPDMEALALFTLRSTNIAPEPVVYFQAEQVLAYRFVEGNTWHGDAAPVGDLFRRLHDHSVSHDIGLRRLQLEPAEILEQAVGLLNMAELDAMTDWLRSHRPAVTSGPSLERLSLVHTDAWAGNIIQCGSEVRLIDWQCPGLGDPAEDVWTFLDSGYEMLLGRPRMDRTARARFEGAYGNKSMLQRMAQLSPYYAFRVAAHCCLRHQQLASENPAASAAYRRVFHHLSKQLTR